MSISTSLYEQVIDHRPWGEFIVLSDEEDHKVKRIKVNPGERLSLQRHRLRREHWLVIKGWAEITRNNERFSVGPGDTVDIEAGDLHRVENRGREAFLFIEIQLGEYFGEDDIERLEDDYGRVEQGEREW